MGAESNDRELTNTGTILLWVIIAIGSWFRVHDLGVGSFRGDTILLWSLANRPVPLMSVLTNWFQVSGAAGQMPMPAFLMKAFLDLLPVPITPFTVRLPFALTGIAAIPVAYFAGRKLVNVRLGLIMAAFVAVNPFHIHFSREAYFYSALFLGYFIYLRAIAGMIACLSQNKAPPAREYAIFGLALFFSSYSQMTGLLLCAVGFFYVMIELWRRRSRMNVMPVIGRFVGLHLLLYFPCLFVEWGPREMVVQYFSAHTDYAKQVVALSGQNFASGMAQAFSGFSWGTQWWAWGLFAVSLGLGLVALKKLFKQYGVLILVFLVFQIVLFVMIRSALGALYESRYIGGLFPFWLFLLACGWYWLTTITLPASLQKMQRVWIWLPLVIPLAGWVYPAYLVTQLTGNPTPYYEVVRWADGHLSEGAPVLVDRWFEPWNEMAAHPSTNVVFMFTVPNEPLETFLQNNWRHSAMQFLRDNPDAAYLELAKTYHDVPSVGPWPWPHTFFANRKVFVNEAGLKLRHMGLAGRGDFYGATTNRVRVELFYNTRDDIIQRKTSEGIPLFALYGSGWRFEKTGPMAIFRVKTQDFLNWRVMEHAAELDVHNMDGQPVSAIIRISGLSPGGAKRVTSSTGRGFEFNNSRIATWEVGPVTLVPGSNTIRIEDVMREQGRNPLFVAAVDVRAVPSAETAIPAPMEAR